MNKMQQRRALRSTVGRSSSPIDEAKQYCLSEKDKPGFEVKYINDFIGSGVFATRGFQRGEFLVEYQGKHISAEEGEKRDAQYSSEEGNFLFFFLGNKCIDATLSSGKGRMVNDEVLKKANCIMKAVKVNNDDYRLYGIPDLPWRQKGKQEGSYLLKRKSKQFDINQAQVTNQNCRETRGNNEISDLPIKEQQRNAENQIFQQLALSQCRDKGEITAPEVKNKRENPDQTSSKEYNCDCSESDGFDNEGNDFRPASTCTDLKEDYCNQSAESIDTIVAKQGKTNTICGDGILTGDANQAIFPVERCAETSENIEITDLPVKEQKTNVENCKMQHPTQCHSRNKEEVKVPEIRRRRESPAPTLLEGCSSDFLELDDCGVDSDDFRSASNNLREDYCGQSAESTDTIVAKQGETNTVCGDGNLTVNPDQGHFPDQSCVETSEDNEISDLLVKEQKRNAKKRQLQHSAQSHSRKEEVKAPENRRSRETPTPTLSKGCGSDFLESDDFDIESDDFRSASNNLREDYCGQSAESTDTIASKQGETNTVCEDGNLTVNPDQGHFPDQSCVETSEDNEISDLLVKEQKRNAKKCGFGVLGPCLTPTIKMVLMG